jgi:hypothetical protein
VYCLERRLLSDEYTRAVEEYREAVLILKNALGTDAYDQEKARVQQLRSKCDLQRSLLQDHKGEHACSFGKDPDCFQRLQTVGTANQHRCSTI